MLVMAESAKDSRLANQKMLTNFWAFLIGPERNTSKGFTSEVTTSGSCPSGKDWVLFYWMIYKFLRWEHFMRIVRVLAKTKSRAWLGQCS